MLEMKQQCERCEKSITDTDNNVYICSYECTFCDQCNAELFKGACPNCGGVLVVRPTRNPKE